MLKKHGWLILITVICVFALLFCLFFQYRATTKTKPEDILSFRVFSNTYPDISENVLCWKQDNKRYVVFLPSYAELNRTEVHITSFTNIQLGGEQLTDGMTLEGIALNTDYELTAEKKAPTTIRFCQSANVSTLYISTESGNMQRVHADKEYKEQAKITLYSTDGQINYQGDFSDQIRGRGNSTWTYFEKKPYNLYLHNSSELLNMFSAKKWVLLANAFDETNLRNKLIYDLANELNIGAPQNEYVDLYINGEYLGLYLLCEKMTNVAERFMPNESSTFFCLSDDLIKLDDPNEAIIAGNQKLYAEIASPSKYTKEEAVKLGSFFSLIEDTVSTDSWKDYFDIDSFATKYLIDEVFTNTDGGISSEYLFWDHLSNKLYTGPCWDCDVSIGSAKAVRWISPNCLFVQDRLFYDELFLHDEFRTYVNQLYKTKFTGLLKNMIEEKIPSLAGMISQAARNNNIRWNLSSSDKQSTSAFLSEFLSERMTFLNSIWLEKETYHKVIFQTRSDTKTRNFIPLFVPSGTSSSMIPEPNDFGITSAKGWYRGDSNAALEPESIITEDIILYVNAESSPPAVSIILTVLSLGAVFMLIVLFILIDHKNRLKKGNRNEKQ